MRRRLSLRRETLTELSRGDLEGVVAAGPTSVFDLCLAEPSGKLVGCSSLFDPCPTRAAL